MRTGGVKEHFVVKVNVELAWGRFEDFHRHERDQKTPSKTSKVHEGTEAVQCCHRVRRRPDGLEQSIFRDLGKQGWTGKLRQVLGKPK